jgi:hypothetical protein
MWAARVLLETTHWLSRGLVVVGVIAGPAAGIPTCAKRWIKHDDLRPRQERDMIERHRGTALAPEWSRVLHSGVGAQP